MRALALSVALFGQLRIAGGSGLVLATRCYAIAIVLWLVASPRLGGAGVPLLPKPLWAREPRRARIRRVVGLEIAVSLCLGGIVALRAAGYDSPGGTLAWLASLIALVLLFREKTTRTRPSETGGRFSAKELALFLLILGVATFFRFHQLGDWLGGIHGDETEAGLEALRALRGEHMPPLRTGWFGQGNLYYWGVALGMKLAGRDLFGLRVFSVLVGILLLVPTYLLARLWFGARVALLSAAFLAISDVAVAFSRLEFSNGTTALSLAAGFAFLFRGLRTGRLLDFLLAGFAHAAGLYFYQGARLTPLLGLAFLVYLLFLLPLLVAVRAVFGRSPAPRRVLRRQALRARRLTVPALVYVLALLTLGAPFVAFSFDHLEEASARVNEKLVFHNQERVAASYKLGHDPLFVGLRFPRAADPLPMPVAFEKTPLSVRVARDGFWPRVLWRQLLVTLSVLTFRFDASSLYTFAGEPIAKPFEAALIILSLAWALIRIGDPRCGALSIWFWGTVIAGGVFTIDAPYVARLVGIVPVLGISAAISLGALSSSLDRTFPRRGHAFGVLVCVFLFLGLARQNFGDYFGRYTRTSPLPFAPTVGQTWFVREMSRRASAGGQPSPHFYDLGANVVYWSHSVNHFLNPEATGVDLVNPSQVLPLTDRADADAVFMVWDHNEHYLPILEGLYPAGREERFFYGPPGRGYGLFTSYRVPAAELQRRHATVATYVPAAGPTLSRIESVFGVSDPPPEGLVYPVRARWQSALFAPSFARYRFQVDAPVTASLVVDGVAALAKGKRTGELVLARGLHQAELAAELPGTRADVELQWGAAGFGLRPVARRFVWSDPRRSFLGIVRALPGGKPAASFFGSPLFDTLPLLAARVDAFLGFQDAGHAVGKGERPFIAVWRGTLRMKAPGSAVFRLHANPGARLIVDRRNRIDIPDPGPAESSAEATVWLEPGPHNVEVWYSWRRDAGILELLWTPPEGRRVLLGPDAVETQGGAWLPGEIAEPGGEVSELEEMEADCVRTFDLSGAVHEPRSLTVAPAGELLVADTDGHRIVRLDSSGRFLGAFGRAGRGPGAFERLEDIALDRAGRIYTLDSGFARVQIFERDGKLLRTLGEGGLCNPAGFGLGPDGAIYVADTCGGRIVKFEEGKASPSEIRPAPPQKLEQPVDVAVGEDGLLYIADLTPRLIALDPATGQIRRTWPLPVGTHAGGSNLALNGTRLYMSEPDRDVVYAIDVSRDEFGILRGDPSSPFTAPLAVACSPEKRLYAIDRNGTRLQVFTDPLYGARP